MTPPTLARAWGRSRWGENKQTTVKSEASKETGASLSPQVAPMLRPRAGTGFLEQRWDKSSRR